MGFGASFGDPPPKPLEIVELPLLGGEDVDDDVTEIDQDPAAVGMALGAAAHTCGLRLLDDRVGDRACLNRRAAGHDDERIGDDGTSGEIEDRDVLGFFVVRGLADQRDEIEFRQDVVPPAVR
ncbi:MAG TPA: hypothetical protein VFE70_00195 [Candidatus Elarobacter sp.]|nr:hypothetical protein [Candidatus Elarobacter sp.]